MAEGPGFLESVAARVDPSTFEPEFDRRRRAWLDPLLEGGGRAWALAHRGVQDDAVGAQVRLPPSLSVGELRIERAHMERWHHQEAASWVSSYLHQHSYPALVSWGGATSVSFRSEHAEGRDVALLLAQKILLSVIAGLRADLVRLVAIDTVGFGSRAAVLKAAVPQLDLVTEQANVSAKLREVQTALRQNIDALGLRAKNLGELNERSPDAARPFTFVFVASTTLDLQRDTAELLASMVRDDIGVKGGVQLILVGDGVAGEHEAQLLTKSSPRVLVVGGQAGGATRLEVADVSGLDTRDGAAHEAFEVVADLEVDDLERVAENCRRHLAAGRPPSIAIPLPAVGERWRQSTSDGISVPLGRAGSREVELRLGGGGLTFNALIGGAVGTGKTVLLHGIISQATTRYSPDELQLVLLDYKEGTEFSIYRSLPHLFALSLGASSDFGLEVLRALHREMSRRATLYKDTGMQDLSGYRRATGAALPRFLVVIDEFQVLLANRAEARDVLEDLIRRGRSSGIHVLLASQSLADMSLNTSVLGQLGARVCLKLSPSECGRFLGHGNDLPSRFQHAGQAVLNEREGAVEGNAEFRAANYDLAMIRRVVQELAAAGSPRGEQLGPPFIYDADTPVTLSPEARRRVVPAGDVLWGLSQELPPRGVSSPLAGPSTVALLGTGSKLEMLLGSVHQAARDSGLTVGECTTADLSSIEAVDAGGAGGPVVVRVLSDGYEAENAVSALRQRLPGLLVLVATSPKLLSGMRDDCICCDESTLDALAFRRAPALQHPSLAARVTGGGEPSVFRLVAP